MKRNWSRIKLKKVLAVAAVCLVVFLVGSLVFLSRYDYSPRIKQAMDLVYEKTGRHLEVVGESRLDISFSPKLVLQDISFENAAWSETPAMIKSEQFEIELDLFALITGNIVIKRAGLINSDILIETNREGVSNFTFMQEPDRPDEPDTGATGNPGIFFKKFSFENCKIVYRRFGDEPPIQVDIRYFQASAKSLDSPVTLDLQAGYKHLNVSAAGSVGAISALFKNETPFPFDLTVNSGDSDIRLTGSIVDLLNDSTLKIQMAVDSEQLEPVSFASKKSGPRIFSSDHISNNFLSALDLDAEINIHKLVLGKIPFDAVKASIVIRNGRMEISPLTGSVFNGRFTGRLHVNPVKEKLGAEAILDVRDLDTHVLCTQFGIKKGVKGLLNASFRLDGTGGSLSGIMADLGGDAWLTMVNGQIDNGFVQSLGSDYFTKVLGFLNPTGEPAGSNQLNCVTARVECQNGIGTIRLLLADMPSMAATGAGRIDFRKETLDISIIPTPKEGIDARGLGKINFSLSNIANAFKIGGTFASPEVMLDSTAAAKSLLKAAGGVVLLGPVGVVGALLGTDSARKNPCPCAISFAMYGNYENCDTRKSETKESQSLNPLKKIFSIFD